MRLRKRLFSLLLALILTLALLPAAEAKTGTLVSNTGTRHVVCNSLSSQALAYYTGNNTYDVVSGLAASSSDPMSSAMFNRLHTLMTNTMTNSVSYNSLTNYWPKTDANNGSSREIFFYSDTLYTGSNMSREHVWPNSHGTFDESGAGSDLHHLRPEHSTVNSTRSSYTMGNVLNVLPGGSYTAYASGGKTILWYSSSANRVEVRDEIKGDVARILLYVWCRWQEPNLYQDTGSASGTDGVRVIESLDTLLQWMEIDPVDTWEMSRNDQCENVQGNRNVFIDYPEYAWLLFGLTPPSDYVTPSGEAMSAPNYTITAAANNSAWGSVSVTGRTVTATPNTGYYVADATVSPAGAATLTRDGNSFTVSNLTADCTVTVNFAAKTALTVSFAANGGIGTMAAQQVYAGEPYTLPACGFTAPGGKVFAGWKWSVDNAIYQPNATVTVNANSTFTAQWATPSDDATYVLVETTPSDWSGEYLIVYNAGPFAMDGSLTSLDATSNYQTVSIDSKTITVEADENDFYFTIAQSGSNYTIKSASGFYIGQTSNANGLSASSTTQYTNTLSLSGTDANIVSSGGAYLRFNNQTGQTRFRYYKSGSYTGQKAISLYKRVVAPEPQAEPTFKTQSLLLDGEIGVSFNMNLPEISGVNYATSYMTFSVEHGTCTARADYAASKTKASGTKAFVCYVNAAMMAEPITATFHYTQNGTEKTVEKTYAIKEYFLAFDEAIAAYPNLFDAKTQTLIRSVADYGHYVQALLAAEKGWTLGDGADVDYCLMDKFYTENYNIDTITSAVADKGITCENNGAALSKLNFTMVFDSATELRVLFKVAKTYTGTLTATVDGNDFDVTALGTSKAVQIANIPANLLSHPYEIVITMDGGSATITASALSYVKMLLASASSFSEPTVMQNAAAAIYSYSAAADAVKGK